jgi:hypothetical protein
MESVKLGEGVVIACLGTRQHIISLGGRGGRRGGWRFLLDGFG